MRSSSEQLREGGPRLGGRGSVDGTQSLEQALAVDGANLVQSNLTVNPLKTACNARRPFSTLRGQWRDDDTARHAMHYLRRYDCARSFLAHLDSYGRAESHKIDRIRFDASVAHQVHSFSSKSLGMYSQSGSIGSG